MSSCHKLYSCLAWYQSRHSVNNILLCCSQLSRWRKRGKGQSASSMDPGNRSRTRPRSFSTYLEVVQQSLSDLNPDLQCACFCSGTSHALTFCRTVGALTKTWRWIRIFPTYGCNRHSQFGNTIAGRAELTDRARILARRWCLSLHARASRVYFFFSESLVRWHIQELESKARTETMCYLNLITWTACGHYTVVKQKCSEAQQKNPPSFCRSAHKPVSTDIASNAGVCSDSNRHSANCQDQRMVAWARELGIASTSEIVMCSLNI